MPTYDADRRFLNEFDRLTPAEKRVFLAAIEKFVADLRTGAFRKGLRVKRVRSRASVWEMTWADDGRATFEYGEPLRPGDPHIIWRRVGSHDILQDP